jgi:hypothetical protein
VLTAANGHGLAGTLQIDPTAPTVTKVVTSPASGEETTGHTVRVTLDMSEKVTVGGSPTLLLNDGGTGSYDPSHSSAQGKVIQPVRRVVDVGQKGLCRSALNPAAVAIVAGGGTPFGPNIMPFNAPNLAQCNNPAALTCTAPQIEMCPEIAYYKSLDAPAFNGNANADQQELCRDRRSGHDHPFLILAGTESCPANLRLSAGVRKPVLPAPRNIDVARSCHSGRSSNSHRRDLDQGT